MSATPSPVQSELYAGLLPVEPAVETPVRPTILENDRFQSEQPSLRKRASRALARFLVAFCIGVTATLAWQSYGDAAREMIANSYPQLGWLAPQAEPVAQSAPETIALVAPAAASFDQQQPNAISLDLDAVRQGIDQIAASIAAIQEQMSRSADRIATEQIARSVAKLTAGQEQMTREITKLQAVEQYVLYKNSEPSPRPALAPARNPVPRPSQAPMVR
jgi:hypothetical protein